MIFQITNLVIHSNISKSAITQFYDYSKSKIEKFNTELEKDLGHSHLNNSSFSEFLEIYNTTIDKTFKLEKPKVSKRNNIVNPWITDGINKCVNTKNMLYKNWTKSKSSKIQKAIN